MLVRICLVDGLPEIVKNLGSVSKHYPLRNKLHVYSLQTPKGREEIFSDPSELQKSPRPRTLAQTKRIIDSGDQNGAMTCTSMSCL